jgi:hypothetical protein
MMAAAAIAFPMGGAFRFFLSDGHHDVHRTLMFLYVMPMYFISPFWVYARLTETKTFRVESSVVDLVAFIIAASRGLGPIIPVSGHMSLLVYSLHTTRMRAYRITVQAILTLSVAMKLLIWHDFVTSSLGFVVALGLVAIHRRVAAAGSTITSSSPPSPSPSDPSRSVR